MVFHKHNTISVQLKKFFPSDRLYFSSRKHRPDRSLMLQAFIDMFQCKRKLEKFPGGIRVSTPERTHISSPQRQIPRPQYQSALHHDLGNMDAYRSASSFHLRSISAFMQSTPMLRSFAILIKREPMPCSIVINQLNGNSTLSKSYSSIILIAASSSCAEKPILPQFLSFIFPH